MQVKLLMIQSLRVQQMVKKVPKIFQRKFGQDPSNPAERIGTITVQPGMRNFGLGVRHVCKAGVAVRVIFHRTTRRMCIPC